MLNITDGPMELDRDFSEFVASCAAHDVRFLIVGGYAVAAHGHPRFTKDLDVWVGLGRCRSARRRALMGMKTPKWMKVAGRRSTRIGAAARDQAAACAEGLLIPQAHKRCVKPPARATQRASRIVALTARVLAKEPTRAAL